MSIIDIQKYIQKMNKISNYEYDMSIHSNPDAMAWTKFFRECNPKCNVEDDVLYGWFANAMMAMHNYLESRKNVFKDQG